MKELKPITPNQILENIISEPGVAYHTKVIAASRKGISRSDFFAFAKIIRRSVASLTKILPASYSSLTKKEVMDKETSERIFELAEIYAAGKDVFGGIDKFNAWLESPCLALGGETPFSLLDTSHGIVLVKQEIGRIDHGIFA